MHSQSLLFRFPASLQYLTALRHVVQAFCTDLLGSTASDEQLYQLQLAVSELVTNIILHAYRNRGQGDVEMRANGQDRTVTLDYYDTGEPYHAGTQPEPQPDALEENGYGSFIIQQCVDLVAYDRSADGCNHWRLEKRFA
jgi:anti-sigma regulatory factor (Ser/Thr protein kinase)